MDWLINGVQNSIWSFLSNLATDIMTNAFELITDAIISTSDLYAYFNPDIYLAYIKILAGAFLTVVVAWEAFKQLSGGMIDTEETSLGTYTLKVVFAGLLIYFMPYSISKIFLPLNNILMNLVQSIGVKVEMGKFTNFFELTIEVINLGGFMIIMTLVLAIAFLILGVVAGIRYIDLLFIYMISPIVAVSAIRKGEAIQIWVREAIAVVFTQTIHILLLQILLVLIGTVKQNAMLFVLCIGTIAVMLRGPQVLRKFLYSSGTGSAVVSTAGSGGRMVAMKMMFSTLK